MGDAVPHRLELKAIGRIYSQPAPLDDLVVFKNINLAIRPGEKVALLGPSGVGKSSLLHICGLLEKPTRGAIFIDGRDCTTLTDAEMSDMRLGKIGFIYQHHHLFHDLSVLENIMLPQLIAGVSYTAAEQKALAWLEQVGILDKKTVRPSRLSGGQRQRVSIARAMINDATLILADEPTGNLDQKTAQSVVDMLFQACTQRQTAILMATHNESLARSMDRVCLLSEATLHDR